MKIKVITGYFQYLESYLLHLQEAYDEGFRLHSTTQGEGKMVAYLEKPEDTEPWHTGGPS